jgi:hypothetical protein
LLGRRRVSREELGGGGEDLFFGAAVEGELLPAPFAPEDGVAVAPVFLGAQKYCLLPAPFAREDDLPRRTLHDVHLLRPSGGRVLRLLRLAVVLKARVNLAHLRARTRSTFLYFILLMCLTPSFSAALAKPQIEV